MTVDRIILDVKNYKDLPSCSYDEYDSKNDRLIRRVQINNIIDYIIEKDHNYLSFITNDIRLEYIMSYDKVPERTLLEIFDVFGYFIPHPFMIKKIMTFSCLWEIIYKNIKNNFNVFSPSDKIDSETWHMMRALFNKFFIELLNTPPNNIELDLGYVIHESDYKNIYSYNNDDDIINRFCKFFKISHNNLHKSGLYIGLISNLYTFCNIPYPNENGRRMMKNQIYKIELKQMNDNCERIVLSRT